MRLLILDGTEAGGAARYAEGLAGALASRHDVTLLRGSSDPASSRGISESAGNGFRTARLGWRSEGGFERYRDAGVTEWVPALLERWQPDLVHANGLQGLSTSLVFELRACGVPAVVTLHDFWPACPLGQLLDRRLRVCPGPSPRRCAGCVGEQVATRSPAVRHVGLRLPSLAPLGRLVARLSPAARRRLGERSAQMHELLRAADGIVAPSAFLGDRLAQLGFAGITHVPLGLPPLDVPPPRVEPRAPVRFAFLGSAIPSKGVHVLAAAFRKLASAAATLKIHGGFPDYHGEGGYRARLAELLGGLADDALCGPYTRAELPELLAQTDVVVVPSLWEENAPLVVLEALQAHRPLIVSGHGGLAELVRHDIDGLHVPPGDVAALAAAMQRLLDPELRGRLATDPRPAPSLEEHGVAMEEVYATARRRHARRTGRVGVVIVDHGRPEDAADAARSAEDPSIAPRVVVVENGPASRPVPAGPWQVLSLPGNLGYAGGANAGLAALVSQGCDRVLVLNNDARLGRGCLRRLAEVLEDPAIGAAGPVVVRASDGRVESRGVQLDLSWGRHRLLGHGEAPPRHEGRLVVGALSGAAVMLSAAALAAVGPFDEAFFHGFEDTEWCARLSRHGLAAVVRLGAEVHHLGGSTLGPAAPEPLHYAARNHVRAVETLAPRRGARLWLRRGVIAGLHLAHALRQSRVERGRAVRAVCGGTRAGWRGLSGPLHDA